MILDLQPSLLCLQVREILGRCTCPDQFPMIKVSEGKYRVGDSSLLIFVRVSWGRKNPIQPLRGGLVAHSDLTSGLQVLRSHVMVRVGGGWDTLEHYLDKHDPCRCSSTSKCLMGEKATGREGPVSKGQPLTCCIHSHSSPSAPAESRDFLPAEGITHS